MNCRAILIGHVDHGKSTLGGHILLNSGSLEEDEWRKIQLSVEKDNILRQKYSAILDIDDSEREKGKTSDFIERSFTYKDKNYTLIDTPGHKQFVRSMVNGATAGRIDVAICILSVKTGEFESGLKGQTLEHLTILRGLGLKQLICVLNKIDLLEEDSKKKRLDEIQDTMNKELKKLGYKNYKYINVSAWSGQGIDDLLNTLSSMSITPDPQIIKNDDKLTFKGIFLNKKLKTVGFKCILHTMGETVETEISSILDNKKFILDGNATIELLLEKKINIGKNIILRNSDETIAIGINL